MTRLWACGFETGNILDWDIIAGDVTTATARHGTYSWAYNVNASLKKILPATYTELYSRVGIRTGGRSPGVSFYEGSTLHIRVVIDNSGVITLYRNATLIATAPAIPAFSSANWYCMEIYVKIDDVVGRAVVVIDGDYLNPYIDFTGDTRNGGTGVIDTFAIDSGTAGVTVYCYIDDVAVNSVAGAIHNSWCGDGYGKVLVLNADGDSSQLVGSDGNSVDNYLLVDEVPYNTADWVESATPGEKDLYNVAAPAPAANEVINSVRVVAIAKLDTAGAGAIAVGIKTASEDWSTDFYLNDPTWKACHKFYAVDPADAGAWIEAKVNSLQVGVKVG